MIKYIPSDLFREVFDNLMLFHINVILLFEIISITPKRNLGTNKFKIRFSN